MNQAQTVKHLLGLRRELKQIYAQLTLLGVSLNALQVVQNRINEIETELEAVESSPITKEI